MKRLFGGVVGAITGAIVFSAIWLSVSSDGFAFLFGLAATVPLGVLAGGGLGAWGAGRTDWSRRKPRLIGGCAAAFAALSGLVTFCWLTADPAHDTLWRSIGPQVLGPMLLFSSLLSLVSSVFGGIVGAVVGAAVCLFAKPPAPDVVQSAPAEEVWPPPPTVMPREDEQV